MQDITAGLRASAGVRTRDLVARLKRTTPRERVLLAVLVLGALVYAPIAASDWRAAQETRYVDAMSERSSARLAAAAARRIEAATADQAALEDMETWGFEASNVAVAQVRIEQQLVEAATRAGLTNLRVTTDSEVETIGPTQWLGAEVQANLLWTPTFAFLDALAAWPEGFRVTGFQYEMQPLTPLQQEAGMTAPTGSVRIGVAFPVILPPTAAAPAAAGAGS
ncbi:hypothetical protein [Brevundimonas sp.]|uniref:hypothetical protein n=1 Tax=Brevundimonas sp. TaxID=1871086 RepID=UPI00258D0801|nr:hypothetical protein [Brevundimonas sp.]